MKNTVPMVARAVFLIAIVALCAATNVLAEDEIVPFDPNAPFWDGVRYVWNLLKRLI